MKVFLLFSFFLLIGCTSKNEKNARLLDKELAVRPLLSAEFDSLIQNARELPSLQYATILFRASSREEEGIEELTKQEELLLEALPLVPKKKEMLLQLNDIYRKMSGSGISDANTKGIRLCEELENNYSLSQVERWKIEKNKAIFLNKHGLQKQYLPIWAKLLIEHQAANKPEYIIEDLHTIANHFSKLDDSEKGLSLCKEAYQLAKDNQLTKLQNECLIGLINASLNTKRYQETINYIHEYKPDSASFFATTTFSILATCYLKLHKPDSARIYLSKMQNLPKAGNGLPILCRIAETYIIENREDSAAFYLDKAMGLFKDQARRYEQMNLKVFMPYPFLSVYPSFATLLQHNGKTLQANETFQLMEPLMTESTKESTQMELQIKGLTQYSSFCRSTGKYEKALDLLARRDSLQDICNRYNEARNAKNIIDYHESETLIANTKVNIAQALYYKRFLTVIIIAGLFAIFIGAIFFYLYYKLRKRIRTNLQQELELRSKPLDPIEQRFRSVEKEVLSRKLYLNKDLSLTFLQQELNINRADLSKCINTYSGGNFNQWKNSLRIAYVLEHIEHTTNIETLIKESGFASSSSFYSCFKEMTGHTPKEYIDLRLFEQKLSVEQMRILSQRNKKRSGNPSIKKATALYQNFGKLISRVFKTT